MGRPGRIFRRVLIAIRWGMLAMAIIVAALMPWMDRIWPDGMAWVVEDVHRAGQRVEIRVRRLEFDPDWALVLRESEGALEDATLLPPDVCSPEGTTRRTSHMWRMGDDIARTTVNACQMAVVRSVASQPQILRQDRLWLGFGRATVHAVYRDKADGRSLYTTDVSALIIPLGWMWALLVLMSLPALSQCIRQVVAVIRALGRRGRMRRGLCSFCGYDLRATPQKCPECGHAPPLPAKPYPPIRRAPGLFTGLVVLQVLLRAPVLINCAICLRDGRDIPFALPGGWGWPARIADGLLVAAIAAFAIHVARYVLGYMRHLLACFPAVPKPVQDVAAYTPQPDEPAGQ